MEFVIRVDIAKFQSGQKRNLTEPICVPPVNDNERLYGNYFAPGALKNCCCVFLFFISVFFFFLVSETHLYALLRTYTGKIRYINCHQMIKTTPEVLKRKTRYTRFVWYFNLENFFSSNDHEFVCFQEFVGSGLLRCSRFAYVHHRNGAR